MQMIPIKMDGYSEPLADVVTVPTNPEPSVDFSAFIQSPILQASTRLPKESMDAQAKNAIVEDEKTIDVSAEALTDSLTHEMNFFVNQMDLLNQGNVVENTQASVLTTASIPNAISSSKIDVTQAEQVIAKSSIDKMAANKVCVDETAAAIMKDATLQNPADLLPSVLLQQMPGMKVDEQPMTLTDDLTKVPTSVTKKASKIETIEENMLTPSAFNPVIPTIVASQKTTYKQIEKEDSPITQSLTALGGLINKWVAQPAHMMHEFLGVSPLPTTEPISTSYADALKKINHVELDPHIEILPQTSKIDAKETYTANIKIYPPELGHVLAKLKIDKNNAELTITTENATVKAIVEANLTQLRDNFQRADIQISSIQVDVLDPNGNQAKRDTHSQYNQAVEMQTRHEESMPDNTNTKMPSVLSNSIIDAYI